MKEGLRKRGSEVVSRERGLRSQDLRGEAIPASARLVEGNVCLASSHTGCADVCCQWACADAVRRAEMGRAPFHGEPPGGTRGSFP